MRVMVLDTCTLVGGCWIEPGPVVGRFETQYVILLRQRHWHVRLVAGMFGGVLERLEAAEGDGGLEPVRVPAGAVAVELGRDRSALYGLASGRGPPVVREQLWGRSRERGAEVAAMLDRGFPATRRLAILPRLGSVKQVTLHDRQRLVLSCRVELPRARSRARIPGAGPAC
jgi:hypothetical protein